MWVDTALSAALAIVTILIAYLGVHVTLHPAESASARRWYKIGFSGCAISAVSLVIWQGIRNGNTQSAFRRDVQEATNEARRARDEVDNTRRDLQMENARRQQAEKDLEILVQATGQSTRRGITEDIKKSPITVEVSGHPIRDNAQNKQIREELGGFIARGLALRQRCLTDDTKSSLENDAQKWFEEAQIYLEHNLDSAYKIQFIQGSPLPIAPPSEVPEARRPLWQGINSRMLVLSTFVDQLK